MTGLAIRGRAPARAASRRLGLILVTASAVAWSTAGFFARLIALDSWSLLVWRGLFGALGIFALVAWRERGGTARAFARLGLPGLAYALLCTLAMTAFIVALDHSSVAHIAIIYATVPFFAAGLGWLFGREAPSASAVAASAVALAGVGVMVGYAPEGNPVGAALAVAMTLGMAGMIVLARRRPDIPTLPATCLAAALSCLVSLPFAATLAPGLPQVGLLALFGLTQSALGIALFMAGSRFLPPVETALITALDAPLAPIWVWLAFGETPGTATLAGGGIVLVAVLAHVVAGASTPEPSLAPGEAGQGGEET